MKETQNESAQRRKQPSRQVNFLPHWFEAFVVFTGVKHLKIDSSCIIVHVFIFTFRLFCSICTIVF